MIKLNNVIYHYGNNFTMPLNFSIKKGERVAVTGHSGAGKSTLLHLIAGFITPKSGEILLNGQTCTTVPPNRRPVSMLFQENNLFTHLTVAQNIGLGLNPSLRLTPEQKLTLHTVAQQIELGDHLTRYPSALSGGQRQRVALARCLVQHRPILLLDEPFSSLDPALQITMLSLVESVCKEHQLTLLIVTHNSEDVKYIASRNLVLEQGELIDDTAVTQCR